MMQLEAGHIDGVKTELEELVMTNNCYALL